MTCRRATTCLCSLALLGASACEETPAATGPGEDAALVEDTGRSDAEADAAAEARPLHSGSFNLDFGTVTLHDGGYTQPASKDLQARLDIGVDGGAYEAVVGAQWRAPVAVQIEVKEDRVELTGDVPIAPIRCSSFEEEWRSFSIAREPSGALAATFSVEGVGPGSSMGPNGWTVGTELRMTATGTVTPDQTGPSLIAQGDPKAYPEQKLFPWSTVKVQLSEGVDEASFDARLAMRAKGSTDDLPLTWFSRERGPAAGAGLIAASARLASWNDASANGLELHASAGILDPAGNGSSAYTKAFQVLEVPVHASGVIDLSAGPIPSGTWGKVSMLEGSSCESGSCLQIGPVSISDYDKPRLAGLAGRLPLGGKSRVAVRYRVLLDSCNSFTYDNAVMSVEAATPEEGVVATGRGEVRTCNDLGAEATPLRYASDWSDLVIELSTSDGEVGISLAPTMAENIMAHELMGCGKDPVGPSYYQLAILVQRVEVVE